ncbi:PLP-dependent transferase [Aspergillus aculeatinus CBS 121060]|uniref:PLP-dependent transferase n=1 Tax=Aspergillus aculeatinus CBS 121060 TaxID=1448322 RepID=A0ACD1GY00_9EURO|nr:PLP-dependent transferase [Aspergillus aculeatinus CBS 121060]RAH66168.1 PLP-dependent transferase [Aspergillus aculeatinus CBS 121060]
MVPRKRDNLEYPGDLIPSLTAYAVSMSLSIWMDNVDYEKDDIVTRYCSEGTRTTVMMLFTAHKATERCRDFIIITIEAKATKKGLAGNVKIIDLCLDSKSSATQPIAIAKVSSSISAVILQEDLFPIAKQYWQFRRQDLKSTSRVLDGFCAHRTGIADVGTVAADSELRRRPRGYQRDSAIDRRRTSPEAEKNHKAATESWEETQFLEERFGPNLDLSFVDNARIAIRRRLAGYLVDEMDPTSTAAVEKSSSQTNSRGVTGLSDDDVYLYPCGMDAIFNTHWLLLAVRGQRKSISFGFPHADTLKVLQKFGPGCLLYGHGSSDELNDLEARLRAGERHLALFCEFPGNPMLKSSDLRRMRQLPHKYDFAVVVDETIGNSVNVQLLARADVVVNSLTKIFSGDCNVMGGSAILKYESRYYWPLKRAFEADFEDDNYWVEDVLFMERNSRDVVARIRIINDNAEAICQVLQAHPLVKDVCHPKYIPTKRFYDECRTPRAEEHTVASFDRIETAKGPSLGTKFTLTSPYVLLAYYRELEWAAGFGVPADLLRVSVGVEIVEDLKARFAFALEAAEAIGSGTV